jgi:hypothetical protein
MDAGRRLPWPGHAERSLRLCPAARCSGAAVPACARLPARCSACTVQRPHTRALPARRIFSRRPDARHLTRCLTRRARARRHAAARRCRASLAAHAAQVLFSALSTSSAAAQRLSPSPTTTQPSRSSLRIRRRFIAPHRVALALLPRQAPHGSSSRAKRGACEARTPPAERGARCAISVQPQHAGSPEGRPHRCADAELARLLRTASAATLCDAAARSSSDGGASSGWRWRMRQAAAAVGRPRARRRRIRRVRATLAAACGKHPLGLGHGMQQQRRMPQHRQRRGEIAAFRMIAALALRDIRLLQLSRSLRRHLLRAGHAFEQRLPGEVPALGRGTRRRRVCAASAIGRGRCSRATHKRGAPRSRASRRRGRRARQP